jgi:transglutaminase-like putative cysteine protease
MNLKHLIKIFFLIILLIILTIDLSSSQELTFFTVYLKNFSGKVYSEKTSKFKIDSKDSDFILPDTSNQKMISQGRKNNIYNVLLQTGNNYDLHSGKPKTETNANFLTDSRLLNIDDPEIQKLKPEFKNSKDIINDVEKFVYNYISNKTIGLPIISASEILKNKTGDCTEHTVLAVSILRSLGVPARALMGMLLSEEFDRNKNVFVYHMWAEAFENGKWILVDAANPGVKHANRYIAFAYHHLQTEMPLSYLKAVSAMKSFSVEYVE